MFSNEYWSKASHKSCSRAIPRQYKIRGSLCTHQNAVLCIQLYNCIAEVESTWIVAFSLDSETTWWRTHTPEYIFVFLYIPSMNSKLINRAPMRLKASLVPLFAMKLGLNVNITSKLFCGQETHAIYNFHRVLLILP